MNEGEREEILVTIKNQVLYVTIDILGREKTPQR
jgi:hypothetical protein